MQNSNSKMLWLLLVVFLIPLVGYTVFEISAMNEDEAMIKEIYDNQLDAILFSINQSSNDIVETWANKLVEIANTNSLNEVTFDSIFEGNLAVNAVLLFNHFPVHDDFRLLMKNDIPNKHDILDYLNSLMSEKQFKINKLEEYMANGYRKLEPLGSIDPSPTPKYQESLLVFVISEKESVYKYGAILIDPVLFIQQALAPKIQAISQEKFVISAISTLDDSLVYSTMENPKIKQGQTKFFWLFPNYELNIISRGKTMETLVKERATTNILLLIGLNIMLFAGLWFVFRNMKKALQLAQAKSDFVSNVSHEIRTPLSLISMFAETLQMNRLTSEDKKQEYYGVIGQEANRLTGIVNKILNFSKMEANKKAYTFESTELNKVVVNILKTYDYHLVNNGFTYNFKKYDAPLFVSIDSAAVEEAIINLIDNAMKYSNRVKHIIIETGLVNNMAFISVADQGMGISKEDQRYIFDKFFRANKGEIHNTKGTGLGLSLVKHIMDAHNGTITVKSELGKGSKFKLQLPRSKKVEKNIL